MPDLAPSLCPICDRLFNDRHLVDDDTEIFLHYKLKEKCIRDKEGERQEPITVPKLDDDNKSDWWRFRGL